jgi:hypothetical protein
VDLDQPSAISFQLSALFRRTIRTFSFTPPTLNTIFSLEVHMMRALLAVLFIVACSTDAFAQIVPAPVRSVSLSGPRIGITHLDEGVRNTLVERNISIDGTTITQFGWQFEKQFYAKGSGLTALNEWVVLVGGLEQGIAIPSVSWIVGLRSRGGSEFGVGPNVTPTGVALALAAGTTFEVGAMNVPVNVAVVPSKSGMRVSFLTGFSLRR